MSHTEGIAMKNFYVFLLFFFTVGSLTSAENDSSEKENPTMVQTTVKIANKPRSDESETTAKINQRQRRPNSRNQTPSNLHKIYQPEFTDDVAIPNLGFSKPAQNIYLSDYTGEYDIRLHNFQQGQPTRFQAAIGAISAHILNHRNNQEYIPYPPNGNPHNYPAYRGNPRATEPPAVRAYEKETKSDYYRRFPSEYRNPSGFDVYNSGSPIHIQERGFRGQPDFYSQEPGHPYGRRPFYDYGWYQDDGEEYKEP